MDVKELKKLIKDSTAVLVLDDGEPSFVLLGYDMYRDLVSERSSEKEIKISHPQNNTFIDKKTSINSASNGRERESEILDRLNKDILALKDQIEKEEKSLSDDVGIDID